MIEASWLEIGENRNEWNRLLDGVGLADFFQLWAVHVASHPIEESFSAAFDGTRPTGSSGWLTTDIPSLLQARPFSGGGRSELRAAGGWLIRAGAATPAEVARAAAMLNQKRDVLRQMLRGPLVLALHPVDWMITRREATDLWSVHIDVIRLTDRPFEAPPWFAVEEPLSLTELPRVAGAVASARTAYEERRPRYDAELAPRLVDLEALVENTLASGLAGLEMRRLLLRGLPGRFLLSLRLAPNAIDQLRFDLMELAQVTHLVGLLEPPLAVWLANAARLSSPRPESAFFRRERRKVLGRPPLWPEAAFESGLPSPVVEAIARLPDSPQRVVEPLEGALAEATSPGVRACIASDLAVATAAAGHLPSRIRSAVQDARAAAERLGDLRLLGRHHARAAWVRGHLGDRRTGLAEVADGRRIVQLLGLSAGDDLVAELDAVADWLATAAHS